MTVNFKRFFGEYFGVKPPAEPPAPAPASRPSTLEHAARLSKIETQGRNTLTIAYSADEHGLLTRLTWLCGTTSCELALDGLLSRIGTTKRFQSRILVALDGADCVIIAELTDSGSTRGPIRVLQGRSIMPTAPMKIISNVASDGPIAMCVPVVSWRDVQYAVGDRPLRRLPFVPE